MRNLIRQSPKPCGSGVGVIGGIPLMALNGSPKFAFLAFFLERSRLS